MGIKTLFPSGKKKINALQAAPVRPPISRGSRQSGPSFFFNNFVSQFFFQSFFMFSGSFLFMTFHPKV
jgi:hypothetical protein